MYRPEYDDVDHDDRLAQLSSRSGIIRKSFVTDLWMKVLNRAIDDLVMYKVMRDNGVILKEEDLELENSAHSFLFNDKHRIPIDNYKVVVTCGYCKNFKYIDDMSTLAANDSVCPKCKLKKFIEYSVIGKSIKDLSLAELLAIWDINDIDGFRRGARARIDELVARKKAAAANRAKIKRERKQHMVKPIKKTGTEEGNFEPVTEKDLTDFDKGIIQVLDDIKDMLMQKNRKYGNSATNPVRAFSKASPLEQIRVRIDDKISRLIRSISEDEDEDVVQDLIGYLVILAALQKKYIK
jgi:hypothetical protein